MPDVVMPQLGETVTEGTITRWFKAVGDAVARDEPLFEVSTDKVDSEVPAPAAGTLAEIRVGEGDTVDVGTVLAVIADGASSSAPPAAGSSATSGPSSATSGPSAAGSVPRAPVAPAPSPPDPAAPPAAPATPAAPVTPAASLGSVAASAPSSGSPTSSEPSEPSAPSANGAAEATAPAPSAGHGATNGSTGTTLLLSPVVRRLLADNHIDPASVVGTGPGGRITRSDVLGFIDAQRSGGQPAPLSEPGTAGVAIGAPASAPAPAPARSGAGLAAGADLGVGDDELVPFTNIRRRTAEHMVRSKATSAHTLVVAEADFEAVEQVRRSAGERFRAEEGFSLTYLPFVARATVEALRRWPNLNASVGDDALIVHRRIHLAIAVDLAFEGLVAPVVHDADDLSVRGMARRIRDLATRARSKRLSPDDLTGGTFTVTNPGPFGTLMTGPIINQPQVGIVSTDGVKRRPVAVALPDGSEAVAIHSVGLLSLTWDHRAVDGAYAAAFVHEVAELLSTHDWVAEL